MDLDECLIDEVRSRPILYDLGQEDFKKFRKKENVWKEVAENLKLSEVECKKRWKGLRDSYKRCKKMQQIASASNDNRPKKKWKYFDSLRFLDNATSSRQTIENISDDVDSMDSCLSPDNESSTSNKAKNFDDFLDLASTSLSNTCQTFSNTRDEQDSTATHFEILAKKIKEANMPLHIRNRIEAKVSNLVFNEIEDFFLKKECNSSCSM